MPRRRVGLFEALFTKFRVGDRVEVETSNFYVGKGRIAEISTDPQYGYGTKLYPSYQVILDDNTFVWVNGVSLTKL